MISARSLILAAALAGASPALAQVFPVQPLQTMPRPTPDADALADAMRRLGANPRDLPALIEAGELSLKLGDVTAAAALFKRADMIDPMNGRVKAGMARILVSQERPGEALRYFDQAAGYGLDTRSFAGDRALAYDLIGEHERAQRDYRVALKAGENDEVQRRYALSLGISGKRDAAIAAIDTLLRKNDRGAWRARAFILAMTGDVPGAEKIAQTMMPQGMGAALGPFFARLAALPPSDRAFAVHFGELRPTPQRLADARLTPPLPVLAPEPPKPTQLAAAAASRAAPPKRDRRAERTEARRVQLAQREAEKARKREERRVALAQADAARRNARTARSVAFAEPRAIVQPLPARPLPTTVASVSRPPARPTAVAPVPSAPVPRPPVQTAAVTPAPAAPVNVAPVTTASPTPTPVQTAANIAAGPPNAPTPLDTSVRAVPAPGPVPAQSAAAAPLPQPGFSSFTPAPATSVAGVTPAPATAVPSTAMPSPSTAVASVAGPVVAPAAPATTVTASVVPPTTAITSAAAPPSSTTLASVAAPATPAATVIASGAPSSPTPAAQPIASAPPVVTKMNEDSILARIVAGISIPAAELGVAPMRPTPPPATAPGIAVATPASIASAETARRNAEAERVAQQAKAAKPVATDTKPVALAAATGRRTTAQTKAEPEPKKGAIAKADAEPVDPKVATRKAAADKKAAEAKKLADAKKAEEKKKAAEEARLAKADPPRIWVQVAGGANESDLPKAWSAVKAKTPALAGKAAYSTPLRATNRVVTGPFKTDAEARAFINTLAKQGVSAFPFTSAKGQKMTKLGGK